MAATTTPATDACSTGKQNEAIECGNKPQWNQTRVHPPGSTSPRFCSEESVLLRIEPDYGFRNQRADELLPDAQDERLAVGVMRAVRVVTSSREDVESEGGDSAVRPAGSDIESPMSTQAVHGSSVGVQASQITEEAPSELSDTQGEDDPEATSQMFYPRPALFQRQLLPESAWEPDDATAVCHQCSRRFTLFLRRHHCRRCGLVFCDTCSQRRILLSAPVTAAQGGGYYSQQQQQQQQAVPLSDDDVPLAHHLYAGNARATCWRFNEHRACDACAEAVDRLPAASTASITFVAVDSEASGAAGNAYNIFGDSSILAGEAARAHGRHHQRSSSSGAVANVPMRRQHSSSSISVCPVCMRGWAAVWSSLARVPGEGWQEAQERHIRTCIEDTSAEMQGGRRRQSDARRSRSVQGARETLQVVHARAEPVPEQTARRSVGFLSFFDRTPPHDTGSLEAIHHAFVAAARGGDGDGDGHANARAARSPMGVRYVSYKLTSDTPLLGQECPICLEDFEPGQRAARLNCLCTYHQPCINDWLQRTPACPVHYE
ncbi:hypothetical protein LPJ81_002733 [Coemansia sp. IMI 209127]|nr:hypothetical protein LPJ81_002733 [Coemansia sp. IMI 209127]